MNDAAATRKRLVNLPFCPVNKLQNFGIGSDGDGTLLGLQGSLSSENGLLVLATKANQNCLHCLLLTKAVQLLSE